MDKHSLAALLAGAALVAAYGLVPRLKPAPEITRGMAIWAVCILPVFYMRDQLMILSVVGLSALLLAPISRVARTATFLVVAPCLPMYLGAALPFPGINFLTWLTGYKVLVATVLFPLLLFPRGNESRRGGWSLSGVSLTAYVVYTSVIVAHGLTATSGLRFFVDQLFVLAIPFFALRGAIEKQEDLDVCLRALLFSSLILAAIAIIATINQWDFYRVNEPPSVLSEPDTRGGFLRIAATANTHSLGYHLAVGLLILAYLRRRLALGGPRLWLMRGMLFMGVLASGSRGALTGLVIGFVTYRLLITQSAGVRAALFAVLTIGLLAAATWVLQGDLSQLDPYGTFDYRTQLLITSLTHMKSHLWIGDFKFLQSPDFGNLVQGQGIIDVTNLYLQIAVQYGLIGLSLFLMFLIPTVTALMRIAIRQPSADCRYGDDLRSSCGVMAGALVGWLCLVATTSDVGLTLHLGVVLTALGSGWAMVAAAGGEVLPSQTNQVRQVQYQDAGQITADPGWQHQ